MTVTQTRTARSEILALFKAAWDGDPTSASLPVLWDGVAADIPTSGAWARAMVRQTTGTQVALSGDEIGVARHTHTGFLMVQIFTPLGEGLVLSDQLADIVKNGVRGKRTASGVVFRDVRTPDIGPDGQFFHKQVVADFEYDEVK